MSPKINGANLILFGCFVPLRPFKEFSSLPHELGIGEVVQVGSVFRRLSLVLVLIDGDIQRHLTLLRRHLVAAAVGHPVTAEMEIKNGC